MSNYLQEMGIFIMTEKIGIVDNSIIYAGMIVIKSSIS